MSDEGADPVSHTAWWQGYAAGMRQNAAYVTGQREGGGEGKQGKAGKSSIPDFRFAFMSCMALSKLKKDATGRQHMRDCAIS